MAGRTYIYRICRKALLLRNSYAVGAYKIRASVGIYAIYTAAIEYAWLALCVLLDWLSVFYRSYSYMSIVFTLFNTFVLVCCIL